jgi:hypothetical protein
MLDGGLRWLSQAFHVVTYRQETGRGQICACYAFCAGAIEENDSLLIHVLRLPGEGSLDQLPSLSVRESAELFQEAFLESLSPSM